MDVPPSPKLQFQAVGASVERSEKSTASGASPEVGEPVVDLLGDLDRAADGALQLGDLQLEAQGLVRRRALVGARELRQPEVGDFDVPIGIKQNVLRFDVAVGDAGEMGGDGGGDMGGGFDGGGFGDFGGFDI